MAKYCTIELTKSQYLFLVDAMKKVLPDCYDVKSEETLWLDTHEALMSRQEKK